MIIVEDLDILEGEYQNNFASSSLLYTYSAIDYSTFLTDQYPTGPVILSDIAISQFKCTGDCVIVHSSAGGLQANGILFEDLHLTDHSSLFSLENNLQAAISL